MKVTLHYFVNACTLVRLQFIEDAALNLQLTSEALLRDFMEWKCHASKVRGLEELCAMLGMPAHVREMLEELYEARNTFLAHVDDFLFHRGKLHSDPDAYCYEHFELFFALIERYVEIRLKGVPAHPKWHFGEGNDYVEFEAESPPWRSGS